MTWLRLKLPGGGKFSETELTFTENSWQNVLCFHACFMWIFKLSALQTSRFGLGHWCERVWMSSSKLLLLYKLSDRNWIIEQLIDHLVLDYLIALHKTEMMGCFNCQKVTKKFTCWQTSAVVTISWYLALSAIRAMGLDGITGSKYSLAAYNVHALHTLIYIGRNCYFLLQSNFCPLLTVFH